jgi:predicted secreted hydrolase
MRAASLLGLLAAALGLAACADAPAPVGASLAVAEAMAGDTAGYARAVAPRPFVWPADHGPHPAFRTEWWYATGTLRATDGSGRRFGYQFTVFRTALAPDTGQAPRASGWATRQLYMAHVTLSDLSRGRFYHRETFQRGALELAGAQADPLRVWLGPNELRRGEGPGVGGAPPLVLHAETEGGVRYALALRPLKPPVLQGDRGLSPKGPEPGNASFYYSLTRLATAGTVTVGGEAVPVEGRSWLDREWSTSALGEGLVGWDWFALHLDDGRDLMLYRLRRADGTADRFSKATLVAPDGTARRLDAGQFALEPEGEWASPRGGTYPARWRVRLPSENLDLRVTPALADQELARATICYWEGAVEVEGTDGGRPVAGRGYLEMTGYAEAAGAGARAAPVE